MLTERTLRDYLVACTQDLPNRGATDTDRALAAGLDPDDVATTLDDRGPDTEPESFGVLGADGRLYVITVTRSL